MLSRHKFLTEIFTSVAGLPLVTVLSDPKLAHAATSFLKGHILTLTHGKTVDAYLSLSKGMPAPAVVLFHK